MEDKIYFKKRFGGLKEMTRDEAFEMGKFIYSKIATKKTVEQVNNRFIGITFYDNEIK